MKVLITGAAGFIGSNLTLKCLELGWDVVGMDNFSTGRREMVDPKRFDGLPGTFTFLENDITSKLLTYEKDLLGVQVMFHMAALPRVSYSIDYPLHSNDANINGTLNMLDVAKNMGIKRVVYSASSSMYGGQDIPFPTPETTSAHPRSNYALQKYVGLEYCRLYSELYGLDTASLIYFNVFGPLQYTGGAYSSVIPAFMEAAFAGRVCKIDGDGSQSRDFCYIDNVVQANILAATHNKPLMGAAFNIACGDTNSVNDVFDGIQELYKRPLLKENGPPRLGDPPKSLADISKAKSVLGYEPKIRFKEGLLNTFNWWKKISQ